MSATPPRGPAASLPHLPNGSTVTVGSFDGVHLGHQAVLQEIGRRARAAGRASVLVTFDPHPLEVVNPGAAPPLLTTGAERLEILVQSPLDSCFSCGSIATWRDSRPTVSCARFCSSGVPSRSW